MQTCVQHFCNFALILGQNAGIYTYAYAANVVFAHATDTTNRIANAQLAQ